MMATDILDNWLEAIQIDYNEAPVELNETDDWLAAMQLTADDFAVPSPAPARAPVRRILPQFVPPALPAVFQNDNDEEFFFLGSLFEDLEETSRIREITEAINNDDFACFKKLIREIHIYDQGSLYGLAKKVIIKSRCAMLLEILPLIASQARHLLLEAANNRQWHLVRLLLRWSPAMMQMAKLGGCRKPAPVSVGECPICEQELPLVSAECGHGFCVECTRAWVRRAVEEGNEMIRCAAYKCDQFWGPSVLLNCCQDMCESVLKRWEHASILLSEESSVLRCPHCSALSPAGDSSILACSECQMHFCGICEQPAHEALTCQTLIANQVSDAMCEEMIKSMAKECPNCFVRTQHGGGCSHMTCSRCQHQWCWVCRGKYQPGRYSHDLQKCPCIQAPAVRTPVVRPVPIPDDEEEEVDMGLFD